ncbi:MAG: hypothetical protein MJ250_07805 [Alphaproteobacteria bacterium]|nr:hypothetical protein [Alphaproteobacteria bacterium]
MKKTLLFTILTFGLFFSSEAFTAQVGVCGSCPNDCIMKGGVCTPCSISGYTCIYPENEAQQITGPDDILECCAHCSDCRSSANEATCYGCESGYYLSGGTCYPGVACCSGCSNCNHTTGVCSACGSGQYLSGNRCYSCPTVSNGTCTSCSSSTNCTSITCNTGYILQGNSCVVNTCPTIQHGTCTSCSGSTCTNASCDSGYYFDGGYHTCKAQVACTTSNCAACSISTGICSQCKSGYYLNTSNNQCTACSGVPVAQGGTCTTCTSASHCSTATCTSGKFFSETDQSCIEALSACPTEPEKFSSCPTEICNSCVSCSLNGATKYFCMGCKEGYHQTTVAGVVKCVPTCPTGCSMCTTPTNCTICIDGYALINGTCKTCAELYPMGHAVCITCNERMCTSSKTWGVKACTDANGVTNACVEENQEGTKCIIKNTDECLKKFGLK